nr:site-specific integrase [Bacilli bacterium]
MDDLETKKFEEVKKYFVGGDFLATGTVRKRGDKWSYIINLPYDPVKGNYPQIRRSGFALKADAQDALMGALAAIKEGSTAVQAVTPPLTIEAYLTEWLTAIEPTVAPRTHETYKYSADLMTPYIGAINLDALTHEQIETMYHALQDRGLAPSSVHRIHRVLRTALNRAVKRGTIVTSPMVRVDPPNGRIEKRTVLDVAQAHALLDYIKTKHPASYIGVTLALQTGLRRGEICGLTWADVDFERGILRVVRSRQRRAKIGDIVGDPKTAGSIRSIPVDTELLTRLQDWRQRQLITTDSTYVMSHKDGTPIDPMTLARDMRLAITKLKLPHVSFHDLRHTHATLLLQANVPLKIVSERLGHASIAMTADTYSHVTENMQQEATEKIAAILHRDNS